MSQTSAVSIGGGVLRIGHRPSKKLMPTLREAGVTHIATLLSANEGAQQIESLTQSAGLDWLWLPLEGAKPFSEPERLETVAKFLELVRIQLASGSDIYLHCSAGIHRTGMITYALLRSLGIDAAESRELLGQLRLHTREGVTEPRLEWGEQFAAR